MYAVLDILDLFIHQILRNLIQTELSTIVMQSDNNKIKFSGSLSLGLSYSMESNYRER